MRANFYMPLLAIAFFAGCKGSGENNNDDPKKKGRVLKETVATGNIGFTTLSDFKKTDMQENLCQQWEEGKYNFFKDGSVLENPRDHLRAGKWQIKGRDSLLLFFTDSVQKGFIISSIDSRQLRLIAKSAKGKVLFLNLAGNAKIHANMYNDPFHPVNNQWRLKPDKPESDSALKKRITNCLKFFALFYRDNLLRNKSSIDFEGFPKIFRWYRGGIGLPDRDKIDSSWTNCFYDEEDALKGYKLLRMLIVDYEYDWPEKTEWWLQTHSVLEQMYHKAVVM